MREDPVPSGVAKEHPGTNVGILGGGGADREFRPARRAVLLREQGRG